MRTLLLGPRTSDLGPWTLDLGPWALGRITTDPEKSMASMVPDGNAPRATFIARLPSLHNRN